VIALAASMVVVSLVVGCTPPSADQVWRDKSAPIVEEMSAFALEQATQVPLASEWGERCRMIAVWKARAESLLSEWRELPNPQDYRLVFSDDLMESHLELTVASLDEWWAFCLDGDIAHLDRASTLSKAAHNYLRHARETLDWYLEAPE